MFNGQQQSLHTSQLLDNSLNDIVSKQPQPTLLTQTSVASHCQRHPALDPLVLGKPCNPRGVQLECEEIEVTLSLHLDVTSTTGRKFDAISAMNKPHNKIMQPNESIEFNGSHPTAPIIRPAVHPSISDDNAGASQSDGCLVSPRDLNHRHCRA